MPKISKEPVESTELQTAVEKTSGDLMRELQAKAEILKAQADAASAEANSIQGQLNSEQRSCNSNVLRLATALLELKWFSAEAAQEVGPFDLEMLSQLLHEHHIQATRHNLSQQRMGEAYFVEHPGKPRLYEAPGSRAGERAWIVLADFAGRPFRAKVGQARVAALDVEIVGLVANIKSSVAKFGWDLPEMVRSSAEGCLALDGQLAVSIEEINAALNGN